MYSIYTRSLVRSARLPQTTPDMYACPLPPSSYRLLSSLLCAVPEKEATLNQGLGASLLLPSVTLSAVSPGTCLKAPRPSAYWKLQSLSGQLGWQPCQPQTTFLPMQPEVSAREGHTSLQASGAKYRSTKIRFPLREASPGQLKPSPPAPPLDSVGTLDKPPGAGGAGAGCHPGN